LQDRLNEWVDKDKQSVVTYLISHEANTEKLPNDLSVCISQAQKNPANMTTL
jgi:hypothetical protein